MRNYKAPLFAKRHFRQLAGALHVTMPRDGNPDRRNTWESVRNEVMARCAAFGSQFDRQRFAAACETGKECD